MTEPLAEFFDDEDRPAARIVRYDEKRASNDEPARGYSRPTRQSWVPWRRRP